MSETFQITNPLSMDPAARYAAKNNLVYVTVVFASKTKKKDAVFEINTEAIKKDVRSGRSIGALAVIPQDGIGPLLEADDVYALIFDQD